MNNNNVSVIHLGVDDVELFVGLIKVYHEAFEMEKTDIPDREYLKALLAKESMIVCVAVVDGLVVGGFTAHMLPSVYKVNNEIYVYDLAVKPEYQRQGVGTELLTFLKMHCKEFGANVFFLQADIPDTHAIAFYNSLGGLREDVIHFDFNTET